MRLLNNTKELLTYEVFKRDDKVLLSITGQNLIEPRFLLKKDTLYILLYNYTQAYIIKKLPDYIIDSILTSKCYLIENLHIGKHTEHHITLYP